MVIGEGKTYIMNYMQIFIEIYNSIAAVILIYLIGQILFMMRKVDRDLLKARLFLNESVLLRTWVYISIAGASFAIHSFINIITIMAENGGITNPFYIVEITQFIFIISFILAVYNWYVFIGDSTKDKNKLRRKNTFIQKQLIS
jgi:hypothetical protein